MHNENRSWTRRLPRHAPCVLCSVLLAGCAASSSSEFSLWNPFGLKLPFSASQPPIRVGMLADDKGVFDPRRLLESLEPPPWQELAKALSDDLGTPVQVELYTPQQIAFHLESGRLQFALVSGATLEQLREHGGFEIIASADVSRRRGVIVANADSGIRSIPELSDRRFSFGPAGDPVLDVATRASLEKGGLPIDKIKREILPIPGTLQHHFSSFESAKEIVYGGTPAGVMDAQEFEALPDSGGKFTWLGFKFSKDQFNVLGYTEPVAVDTLEDAKFLSALRVDAALRDKVRARLLEMESRHQRSLESLGFARFKPVGETVPVKPKPAQPNAA